MNNDLAAGSAASPAPAGATRGGSTLPIRFTASGSEYFRIWIVNLLLTLVTVGLYHPWAKVRKLRYFYGNTLVGHDAFDFHGDPRRMLRGTLLVGALFVAYSAAGQFSPIAGLVALGFVVALSPALFRASMRFRMANTSWRGLRFQFNGGLGGAYAALLPALLPAALLVGVTVAMPEATGAAGLDAGPVGEPLQWVPAALLGAFVLAIALMPLLLWRVKQYQHGNYALGPVQSRLRTGPGPFYALFAKAFGVSMLSVIALVIVVGGAALAAGIGAEGSFGTVAAAFAAGVVGFIGYIVLIGVSNTYMTSRLQNLVWNRTKSTDVRFESALKLGPLLRLTLKNWLLILLTLGLYWPFAAVASARLRLQSVTVFTRHPVEDLQGLLGRPGANDASGDAAGDLFGLDFGL